MIVHDPSLKQCFFRMWRKIYSVFHLRRSLCHNNDGATLVEFAILAPVFFLLLLGLLDFSLLITKWVLTENAVNEISRSGIVNPTLNVRNEIQRKTLGLVTFDDQNTCLLVRSFPTLQALNQAPAITSCSACPTCSNNAGSTGAYVLYQVIFTYNFVTPVGGLMRMLGSEDPLQSIKFTTSTVLRNE